MPTPETRKLLIPPEALTRALGGDHIAKTQTIRCTGLMMPRFRLVPGAGIKPTGLMKRWGMRRWEASTDYGLVTLRSITDCTMSDNYIRSLQQYGVRMYGVVDGLIRSPYTATTQYIQYSVLRTLRIVDLCPRKIRTTPQLKSR